MQSSYLPLATARCVPRSSCLETDFVCQSRADWFATATGQVGWAVDHALLYIKDGAAWVQDEQSLGFPIASESPCTGTGGLCSGLRQNQTRVGPPFDAGITYAFDPHWSAFIECNHMDFGSRNFNFTETEGGDVFTETLKISQAVTF